MPHKSPARRAIWRVAIAAVVLRSHPASDATKRVMSHSGDARTLSALERVLLLRAPMTPLPTWGRKPLVPGTWWGVLFFAVGCGEGPHGDGGGGDDAGEAGSAGARGGSVSQGGGGDGGGEAGDSAVGGSSGAATGGLGGGNVGGNAGTGDAGDAGEGGDAGHAGDAGQAGEAGEGGAGGGAAANGGQAGDKTGGAGGSGFAGMAASGGVAGSGGMAGSGGIGGSGGWVDSAMRGAVSARRMPPVPLASRLRRVTTRFSTSFPQSNRRQASRRRARATGTVVLAATRGCKRASRACGAAARARSFSNDSSTDPGIDDDCDGSVNKLGTVTCGMGACERTVSACEGGVLATCLPGSPAAASDDCNGADDDCDGAIDEDCATCVRVSTTGDDAAATASCGAIPFATVQAAIDFADVHRSEVTRVCVAAGAACGGTATFAGPAGADLTMRNGISVLANYESTSWTRCSSSTTRLAPQTGRGVVFPPAVAERTVLDGFAINRFLAETSAGVTVDGARGVLLSNLSVVGGPPVTTSYGVNVVNGGDALLFRNRIETATAFEQGIALRAVGSRVVVQDSCPTSPDAATGRCTSVCSGSGPEIRATYALATFDLPRAVSTRAIVLDDSPGSRIERSAVCWKTDLYGRLGAGSAIEIAGDATGDVVRASSIRLEAAGPLQAVTPTKVARLAQLRRRCGPGSWTTP